ncbi:MAG TPA: class I SAM-dependent methyltransferase [Gammaproteobacteria bacterium]|nr:class I SAM-dependent methyltransferase [Gammaproteobacteria bacterium]
MTTREKWNRRYSQNSVDTAPLASRVLGENLHLLPETGHALDLACGRGGNAISLAEHGLHVEAWDISDVAIEGLQTRVDQAAIDIHAHVRDVETSPPEQNRFDVIVISYFLERNIIPSLIAALRPGGLMFYQTFTRQRVTARGPAQDEFRLAGQELLQLFHGLKVLYYREEGTAGDIQQGCRDEAQYIGMKPA